MKFSIIKDGDNFHLHLPHAFVQKTKWEAGDRVVAHPQHGFTVIKKRRPDSASWAIVKTAMDEYADALAALAQL